MSDRVSPASPILDGQLRDSQSLDGSGDRVLRQRMRVAARKGGWVLLEAERAGACGACAARAGCRAGALGAMLSGGPARVVLPEPDVRIGEEVEVAMSGAAFLRASALAYLLPPAALSAAAAFAAAAGLSDGEAALLCAPTLLLSLAPLWLAERLGDARRALRVRRGAEAASAPIPDPQISRGECDACG